MRIWLCCALFLLFSRPAGALILRESCNTYWQIQKRQSTRSAPEETLPSPAVEKWVENNPHLSPATKEKFRQNPSLARAYAQYQALWHHPTWEALNQGLGGVPSRIGSVAGNLVKTGPHFSLKATPTEEAAPGILHFSGPEKLKKGAALVGGQLGKMGLASGKFLGRTLNPLPRLAPTSIGPRLLSSAAGSLAERGKLFELARDHYLKRYLELRLWNDPHFKPNVEEQAFLDKHGFADDFNAHAQFLKDHPVEHAVRKSIAYSYTAVVDLAISASVALAIKSGLEPTVDLETFALDPKYAPSDDEIQIVVDIDHSPENIPYPHMALRIGDRIYTYDQDLMGAANIIEYYGKSYEKGQKNTLRAPSTQVLTLTLPKEEIKKLQIFLESERGKVYANKTGVVDCVTMIVSALKKHTSLDAKFLRAFDAAPHLTYLGLLMEGENPKTFTVDFAKDKNTFLREAKNLWMNRIEQNLFFNPVIYLNLQIARHEWQKQTGGEFSMMPKNVDEAVKQLERDSRDYFMSEGLGKEILDKIEKSEDKSAALQEGMAKLETIAAAFREELQVSNVTQENRVMISALLETVENLRTQLRQTPRE